MGVALEYVIESMPVKNLNKITFGENTKAESHINEFILRSYYQNDQKPRNFIFQIWAGYSKLKICAGNLKMKKKDFQ